MARVYLLTANAVAAARAIRIVHFLPVPVVDVRELD
jgi:hypothetical protein